MADAQSALQAVEAVLESPVRVKSRRRIQEVYDLRGSPTYQAWKILYQAVVPYQNLQAAEQLQPSMTPCATKRLQLQRLKCPLFCWKK